MMFNYPTVETFKPDLRTPKSIIIQRGLAIRLLRIFIFMLLDVTSVILAWKLASFNTNLEAVLEMHYQFMLLIIAIEVSIIATTGLYKLRAYRCNYVGLFTAVCLAEIILLFVAALYEPNNSILRSTLLLFWLFSLAFICVSRFLVDALVTFIHCKGIINYPVFLITDSKDQKENIRFIERENRYSIQGIGDSSILEKSHLEDTFEYLHQQGIVEAFVSWNVIKDNLSVCWHFQTAGITLHIIPSQKEVIPQNSVVSLIGQVPCPTISAPVIAGSDFLLKRLFDISSSLVLLLLLSPVFLLIAIVIKLDSPGPIFFRQDRIGLHNQSFKIWKFRTMVINAEKLIVTLEAQNETKDGILFKVKDDPRITRVGKFLRRYSIDELPQLFNIILGQMSLVGPRPHALRDVEKFKPSHFIRQEVLPGITGLWQVSGRSDIDNFEDVVKLDISYIENWSIWLDLQILLKTIKVVLQKKGAY